MGRRSILKRMGQIAAGASLLLVSTTAKATPPDKEVLHSFIKTAWENRNHQFEKSEQAAEMITKIYHSLPKWVFESSRVPLLDIYEAEHHKRFPTHEYSWAYSEGEIRHAQEWTPSFIDTPKENKKWAKKWADRLADFQAQEAKKKAKRDQSGLTEWTAKESEHLAKAWDYEKKICTAAPECAGDLIIQAKLLQEFVENRQDFIDDREITLARTLAKNLDHYICCTPAFTAFKTGAAS